MLSLFVNGLLLNPPFQFGCPRCEREPRLVMVGIPLNMYLCIYIYKYIYRDRQIDTYTLCVFIVRLPDLFDCPRRYLATVADIFATFAKLDPRAAAAVQFLLLPE